MVLGQAMVRLLGAQRLVGREVTAPVLSLMGEPDDLRRVLERTTDLATWAHAWRDVAAGHLSAADAACRSTVQRVRRLRLATLSLAFANQGHSMRDLFEEVSAELVAAHQALHDLVDPPYEPVEVRVGPATVPGLLRVPHGDGPHAVAVVLQGLERSKEQAFPLEDALVARGLAVLNVDQPGVGAALARGVTIGGADTIDHFAAGLSRAIAADDRLDAGRVMLFGFSLGGAWALAMSGRMTPRAVVTLGAPLDLEPSELGVTARRRARFAAGVDTDAEVRALLSEVHLNERLRAATAPLLVLHGSADPVVPVRNAASICEAATAETQVRIFPGGDHSCTQYAHAVWELVADHLADAADAAGGPDT